MKLSERQLRLVQASLYDAMDKNFSQAAEAIDKGNWGEVDYRRSQRKELRELLEAVRVELKK